MNTEAESVRIDRWLWAVRIFKTRSDSNSACRSTRIKLNGNTAKPASKVRIGDEICIRKNSYTQKLIVKELIEKRVGAHIALEYFADQTPARERKQADAHREHAKLYKGHRGKGRPTKKDRRTLEDLKNLGF